MTPSSGWPTTGPKNWGTAEDKGGGEPNKGQGKRALDHPACSSIVAAASSKLFSNFFLKLCDNIGREKNKKNESKSMKIFGKQKKLRKTSKIYENL